jgi:hypothetical protein
MCFSLDDATVQFNLGPEIMEVLKRNKYTTEIKLGMVK